MNLVRLKSDPEERRSHLDIDGLNICEPSAEILEDGQVSIGGLATESATAELRAAEVQVIVMQNSAAFDEYLYTMDRRDLGVEPGEV